MPRPSLALALALVVAALAPPASVESANLAGGAEVVVAVLDTGLRATHAEFDYVAAGGDGTGPAGQLVAWWDFTDEKHAVAFPGPGATWDTRDAPYDLHGHGTAVASLVGGSNVSLAPGTRLAIAKVGTATGGTTGDGRIMNMAEAYRWAVDTVHADIVSISIGSVVPWVGVLDDMDDLVADAHAKGVLTVVAAGNGAANACGPATAWSSAYGYSRHVLAVGRLFEDGDANALVTCTHLDPDVVSNGYDVRSASHTADTVYVTPSGTSFATPLVAGAVARMMETAIANAMPTTPDHIERLVLTCADPQEWPYAIQGYGLFYRAQLPAGLAAAATGTPCAHPAGTYSALQRDVAEAYHDLVVEAARMSLTETTDV